MPVNENTSLPANSPLRSAPLVEGKIYKDTDTNKCIGKFAGIKMSWRELANKSGDRVPWDNYQFNLYNYETGTFDEESSSGYARKMGEKLQHNLVEVNEGECGRKRELLPMEAVLKNPNNNGYWGLPAEAAPMNPNNNGHWVLPPAAAPAAPVPSGGRRRKTRARKTRKTKKSRKHGGRRH